MTCLVSVCHGCCCGNFRKHPDVEHDDHLRLLRAALGRNARIRVTQCLGHCSLSNIITVAPSRAGRHRGGRLVWLGFVLDDEVIAEIADWVLDGGPGIAPLPARLRQHRVRPDRRSA